MALLGINGREKIDQLDTKSGRKEIAVELADIMKTFRAEMWVCPSKSVCPKKYEKVSVAMLLVKASSFFQESLQNAPGDEEGKLTLKSAQEALGTLAAQYGVTKESSNSVFTDSPTPKEDVKFDQKLFSSSFLLLLRVAQPKFIAEKIRQDCLKFFKGYEAVGMDEEMASIRTFLQQVVNEGLVPSLSMSKMSDRRICEVRKIYTSLRNQCISREMPDAVFHNSDVLVFTSMHFVYDALTKTDGLCKRVLRFSLWLLVRILYVAGLSLGLLAILGIVYDNVSTAKRIKRI